MPPLSDRSATWLTGLPPSDFPDPRQILDRLRGQTRPGFLGSRRQNFMGRPLNFSASRRKWLLMAIDTRASDRGPQGTTTPGPLRMICQGRCVRQASSPQAAMVTIPLTKGPENCRSGEVGGPGFGKRRTPAGRAISNGAQAGPICVPICVPRDGPRT